MRVGILVAVVLCLFVAKTLAAQQQSSSTAAQQQSSSTGPAVPRVVRVTGTFTPASHMPAAPVETITLAIYADETGGAPLWQETQDVAVDADGRYTVLLGATLSDGLPLELFASGDARWLGRHFNRPGEPEQARVLLASVPYALKASDADTLGGHPASAYLLVDPDTSAAANQTPGAATKKKSDGTTGTATTAAPTVQSPATAGTTNYIGKFTSATDLGNSAMYESGGRVGVNTTNPADAMHVSFLDNGGSITGYAVQNLGSTGYSGMLFYDHNGALGQFQGFNNSTHEYRINNIAAGASINFMLGSTSKFLVASNGNIGIGTLSPSALLEVSNAVPGGPANVWTTSYTNAVGPYYLARRARGTAALPTAVQNGDGLAAFWGGGYGTTAFNGFAGAMTVQAAQNWTDTAQGTALTFITTPIGSTSSATRMTLDATGNLGVGTTTTPAAGVLEVSNAANAANGSPGVVATTFSNTSNSLFIGRRARGTSAAPTAVQNGDNLAAFLAQGYGASSFSGTRGGMFVRAAENWTNIAQGTSLAFNTTGIGTTTPSTKMTIDQEGKIGIGTTNPNNTVEIVRDGETSITGISYNDNDASALFFARARGTSQAPSAVHAGDSLGYFAATGYGATDFGNGAGAIAVVATENWTDTANGNAIGFGTTPTGTTDFVVQAIILSNGNVGLGTPEDVNGLPTATDRLQAFGDIRVGTSGTNGCLKNFAGTGIAGTCASDRRFKQNITPFAPVLNQLTALQPVHYFWRAKEFPDRHFGDAQAYGLIAQDVELVLPELVVTDKEGYKAIDYSKLPLLTIQAIKELKAENDALKARNDALKTQANLLNDRVAAIERLIKDVRSTAAK